MQTILTLNSPKGWYEKGVCVSDCLVLNSVEERFL